MIQLFYRRLCSNVSCICLWSVSLTFVSFSQNSEVPQDSVLSNAFQDTTGAFDRHAEGILSSADSLTADSLSTQTTDSIETGRNTKPLFDTTKSGTMSTTDSVTLHNGLYFGAGIGWTLGNLDIVQLWRAALPDSLSRFNLAANSFRVDSTFTDPAYIDTAAIKYVIKEHPEHYNITFPVSLSLNRITDRKKYGMALSFAYINKTLKSVIIGTTDSLSESVNLKHYLRTYSFVLSGNYSFLIPAEYFTIEGVERSYFTIGAGIAPQIVQKRGNAEYGGRNERLKSIQRTAEAVIDNQTSFGAGFTVRAGVISLHHVNERSALEFGVFYTISRFDFFYADGHRLSNVWLNPYSKNSDKPLSYLSNRFEVSVSFLRRKTK